MSHYCNPRFRSKPLVSVRLIALAEQRVEVPGRVRHHQRRLDDSQSSQLITAYLQGMSVKELAHRFGVHRHTVTAVLTRYNVEIRQPGLRPDDVEAAAQLYRDGWSLVRLGKKFSVDGTTVGRALKAAGVEMRSPNERHRDG
ncbi:helix-turn-helix domain-containing protein [Candidatus Saccharibacteria bacterium]|nr:helix-turn-helix domain-containing protein [Candidatus Saccharibacteria bacterium]